MNSRERTALELHGVTKEYDGSPPVVALRTVSLTIGMGEFAAIVGPSGSGKTTLLSIAGTLERPTAGRVVIAGSAVEDLSDDDLADLRANEIGFVFQRFFLLPMLSTLDNVADGLLYRGIPLEQRRHAARDALEAVNLDHRATHRPSQLSGGESQRAAIARALVGDPKIILADEPTGNVDSAQGAEILQLLTELNAAGRTIVVISHSQEISDALPRTIRLRDGSVLSDTALIGARNRHVAK
jgi:putative ABC transport system ATP-binding protein